MNESNRHNDENELQAPQKLVAALKNIPQERMFVPPSIDRAITNAARQHLQKSAVSRRIFSSWFFWPALATACVAVAAMVSVFMSRSPQGANYVREDLNHDGRVDILDAFALARQLKDGKAAPTAFDLNGDGLVDRRDAAIIAARAVRVEKGDRS